MRKWTYLVAALLLGGATATFTGCMDNEEPAGITDLRGAKAEFIRAKVAYENALTAVKLVEVEKDKVDVELQKVTLELNKLTLEKEKAVTEHEKERIRLEMTTLAEKTKGELLTLQGKTLEAEKLYQEALVALELANLEHRDTEYEKIITPVTTAIKGLRSNLVSQNGILNGLEGQLIAAKAQYGKAYRRALVLDSLKFENGILVQKEMVEIYKAMKQSPVTDWIKQIVVIDNQLADISTKSIDLSNKIAEKANILKPIQDEVAQLIMKKAVVDKVVTIPVVDAAIQDRFIVNFRSTVLANNSSGDFYKLNDLGKFEMTAAYTSIPTSLVDLRRNNWIEYSSSQFENYYQNTFGNTYYNTFNTPINGDITAEHVAKAKAKLAELSLDADKKNDIYKADLAAWEKALKAYKAAAKAYGYELNPYADRIKDLNDYYNLATDKKTKEVRDALKTKLAAYYAVRVPVDNLLTNSPRIATVAIGTESVRIDKALSNAAFTDDMFVTLLNGDNTALLGNSIDLTSSGQRVTLPNDAKNDGAIQAYVRSSNKLYNTQWTLGDVRETAMTEEEYLKLEAQGSVPSQGSFFTYMKASQGVYIFNTIESWLALSKSMKAIDKGFDDQLIAIENEITVKEASYAGEDDKMYRLEVERYLLDGTRLSDYNPYTEVYATPTKKNILNELKNTIRDNTNVASNSISFKYYTVDGSGIGRWTTDYQTIENIVPICESAIQETLKYLDKKKAEIEAFDKGLFNNGQWASVIKNIEAQIAEQKKVIGEITTDLTKKEAQLKSYLDAYAKK